MEHNAIELSGLTKRYADFTLGPVNLTLPGGANFRQHQPDLRRP